MMNKIAQPKNSLITNIVFNFIRAQSGWFLHSFLNTEKFFTREMMIEGIVSGIIINLIVHFLIPADIHKRFPLFTFINFLVYNVTMPLGWFVAFNFMHKMHLFGKTFCFLVCCVEFAMYFWGDFWEQLILRKRLISSSYLYNYFKCGVLIIAINFGLQFYRHGVQFFTY